MELDHEKFAGAQELMEISTKVSQATAALAALKADEATYLTEREAKLVSRLQQALVDSSDLIKAIGGNHDALVGYRNQVTGLYDTILSLIQGVTTCTNLVGEASKALETKITKHEADITEFKQSAGRERIQIEGERAELASWRDRLGEGQRLLNDRSAMLERTIERLKT